MVKAVAFLNNRVAVSGGGNNNEIYIWRIRDAKPLKKIEGVGRCVWSVGVNRNRIAWGNIDPCPECESGNENKLGKLQKYIDLNSFKIGKVYSSQNFKRINTVETEHVLSLQHRKGGKYGFNDAILDIKKNGKTISSIIRDGTNGYRHNCYGFYRDYIISGGANGSLRVYNLKGQEIANLVGHEGEVLAIAIDGDRLVSGSSDQTIRVWDLKKLRMDNGNFRIYPLLNIFISKESEWVVWSNSGYYNSSVMGAKYIGFHINQGANKEALFVSADKYPEFYRPDIIEYIIKGYSEEEAIRKANAKRKVSFVNIIKKSPPILTLLSPSYIKTKSSRVKIQFSIESKTPIQKYIITRNGELVSQRGLGQVSRNIKTISIGGLERGKNIIKITAKNQYATSEPIVVEVNRVSGSIDIYKPTLYILSVGVSRYKNGSYNLHFADRDAKSIADIFKTQEGGLYKRVVTKKLLNKDATRDNILDALDRIEQKATQKDVVIIFLAGHGENDRGGYYYFLTHEADRDRLRSTALNWAYIKQTIETLPSKIILMVDTCHSGNVIGTSRRDITGAIKTILNTGRSTVVMSASTGRGYSIEKDIWGHGAFTKAILEGLKEKRADNPHKKDGHISLKELDFYVTYRVNELTNGEQKPTTIIPDGLSDYVLWAR